MDNQYDVIVVGAGNGGLVAAATCAKSGLRTLLVEKHNIRLIRAERSGCCRGASSPSGSWSESSPPAAGYGR